MKKGIFFFLFVLILGFVLGVFSYYYFYDDYFRPLIPSNSSPASVRLDINKTDSSFARIVNNVSPAVVNISTSRRVSQNTINDSLFDFFTPFKRDGLKHRKKEQSLGSGVIVSKNGYIITNYHVVENADEIRVTLYNKTSYKGKIVGLDPKTDVAVVKISAEDLPAIPWGDSDSLRVGDFILAICNPFGLSHPVTMGIISAVGRANVGIADYQDFIHTDAAITPGNSGFPLVNIRGELVGINTAIFSRNGGYQGIGFAVPSNMARNVFGQLVKNGKVIRGWIGVSIQDINSELANNFGLKNTKGALVSDIIKDSPAEKAGIRRGDVIISFNGTVIDNVSVLRNIVAQSRIGSEFAIGIVRNKKAQNLRIRIAELPHEYSESGPVIEREEIKKEVLGGITVIELSRDIARQLGLGMSEKGVVIVNVESASSADDAGLRKGDVIQEIDRKRISSLDDFNAVASSIEDTDNIVLFINRNGRKFYVALKAS